MHFVYKTDNLFQSIRVSYINSSVTKGANPCPRGALQKKAHPWHFGPNEFFSCHTYDTSMTIIVTKPGIIIDVVGSYFYDKKSWQKMGFSSWAGRRCSCRRFFGPSMMEKTMVEVRARKISGSSRLRWVVGDRAMHISLVHVHTYARVCEELALTEPKRGVGL